MRGTLKERFEAKIDKTPGHGPRGDCWVWTGYRTPLGYGRIFGDGTGPRVEMANRVALRVALGRTLTRDEYACHACDFPPCVRVGDGHIFLGDAQINLADAAAKGRMRSWQRARGARHGTHTKPASVVRGERHPRAAVTVEQVHEIRARLAIGENQSAVAREIGCSRRVVHSIARGRTWRSELAQSTSWGGEPARPRPPRTLGDAAVRAWGEG